MLSTALCGSTSLSTKVSAVLSVFHCSHMKGLHVLFTWIFSVPSCQFPIAASVCCLCSNLSKASPDNSACCYLDRGRLLLAFVNVAGKFLQEPWSGCSASYTTQDSDPSSYREASGNCGSGNEKSTTVSGAPFLPSLLVTAVPHQVPHELIFLTSHSSARTRAWSRTTFQSDLARASESQHYFTWTTWFLQSTSSRAQRRQASAPWAPPCSTPSFYEAFPIPWIDRFLQYRLTFNKPTAQPSCCKGAFLLQGPHGFFVLCFTQIASFVVVKRPRCAKGHRHPFARCLAFEATSTLTAPVTQNLRMSTSAARSSSQDQLNRFVPHVRITTNSAIALVRLAQALLPTGSFWLVFILLGPMYPFVPLSPSVLGRFILRVT